jgi:hypothetical protein
MPTYNRDILDYTIRYRTMWTIVGVLFAVVVAGLIAWQELKPPSEEEKARQEVKQAERLAQRAEGCARGDIAATDQELLGSGTKALEAARESLQQRAHSTAAESARRAQDDLRRFVDRVCSARDTVAEFTRIQGEVKVKKVNSPRWVLARKGPLAVGDRIWATSGVAEILYPSNGERQQLRPGTIIEIKNVQKPPDGGLASVDIGVESGQVSMQSVPGSRSTIESPHLTAEPSGDVVEVAVAGGGDSTAVTSLRGGTVVKTQKGETATLTRSSRVRSGTDGKLAPPTAVLPPPEPKEPLDNRVFSADKETDKEIAFLWLPTEGATGYRFQIGLNELFVPVLNAGDQERVKGTSAVLTAPPPQTYYWRVAAVDSDGIDGQWSEVRRFSIRGGRQTGMPEPPKIDLIEKLPIGDKYIIRGKTQQYVAMEVYLNGHKYGGDVSIDENGEFRVLVTLAQEGKNVIELVAHDTYGQETRMEVPAYFSFD